MKRPRIAILASDELFRSFFQETLLERLSGFADWTRYAGRQESPELRDLLDASDAAITTWHSPCLDPGNVGSRLRLVAHCGGEVKARVDRRLFERLVVTNAAEPMAAPVAEMALALCLVLVRRIAEQGRAMRDGMDPPAVPRRGETLAGRRVGIVGLGRAGRAFARLVAPFAVDLVAADPWCSEEVARAAGVRLVELDDLLRSSSVVVLTAAATDETRGLLDARRLGLLADGSFLVNVARGSLVEIDALLAKLRTGRISAALDVTDPLEPLPRDHELRRLPNVILTPHLAGGGEEVRRAMAETVVEDVERFFRGETPRNVVTRDMLARMT